MTRGPARRAGSGWWRRFAHDSSGAYMTEFALVSLPFFGLLLAPVEVAWVSFNAEQLQAAVDVAARQVLTGKAQASNYGSGSAFAAALLCPTTGKRLLPASWDCSKLIVDVRTATNFAQANNSASFYQAAPQYCLGAPSTVVVLRVAYPMPASFPMSIYNRYAGLSNQVYGQAGWFHVLVGAAAFKTEPYTGSTPAC